VDDHRLGDGLEDALARVEARVRILEHELHAAAHATELLAPEPRDVLAAELDRPGRDRDLAQDRAARRGLTGAGLADEAEGLARPDLERDVVDGVQEQLLLSPEARAPDGVVDAEPVDADERLSD